MENELDIQKINCGCEGPNERMLSHDWPEIIRTFFPYFFFKYSIPFKKNKRKMIIKTSFFFL